jgi:N-dimethylarginine dimethylaminohydrolase
MTGVDSMAGRLRKVGMRRPGAILRADHRLWHYTKPLDPDALTAQFNHFASMVEKSGAEIVWLPDDPSDGLADSVFTYDPSFVFADGAVIMQPGKELRVPEAELHRRFYDKNDIPVIGEITPPGRIEGGDCYFLDATTLAVGRGFRTNQEGIDQLRAIIEPRGITVEQYDLPYLHGPDACLHLLSVVSPLDHDLALVYAPLVPTALYQRMVDMGYKLLHAPAEEFDSSLGLNLNVLATAPRRCIAVDGFNETHELMRAAGCEVQVFTADELCLPCEGGPTCLTRPLVRD